MKKIVLCILTRNELECLKIIFPKIPPPGSDVGYDQIYAIDGGSTDGTVDFFERNNIPILSQSKRGRGEAFLLAFQEIKADGYIFFSPDGNEDVSDLSKFKPLLETGHDLVIASRMMDGAVNEEDSQIFKLRKWANNVFNLIANICFRRKGPFITDSINGFRALTYDAAKILSLDAYDYTIEYQMTIRALKKQLNIAEFPTHEYPRVAGKTGASSIPTGFRFIKRFFKELFSL